MQTTIFFCGIWPNRHVLRENIDLVLRDCPLLELVSTWHDVPEPEVGDASTGLDIPLGAEYDLFLRNIGLRDYNEMGLAQVVVIDATTDVRKGCGNTITELGIAIGQGAQVIVVGELGLESNIYRQLPQVVRLMDWAELRHYLRKMYGQSPYLP